MDKESIARIAVAGLLHNIGRFMWWAGGPQSPSVFSETIGQQAQIHEDRGHAILNRDFFDLFVNHQFLAFMPEKGHIDNSTNPTASKTIEEIIHLADFLAAGSDICPAEAPASDTIGADRLHSIFEHLSISEDNTPQPAHRHRLTPLDSFAKNIFPVAAENFHPPDLNPASETPLALWEGFVDELETVTADRAEHFVPLLVSLLEKYTWCIPGSTDRPDVSFFDHGRTTAAIAASLCRLLAEPAQEPISLSPASEAQAFILLAGDISGIQDYIFKIKNVGIGGTAKRLRARSFFVSAVADLAAYKFLHGFDLPITNLIMGAGGKFYLLLPAIEASEGIIAALRRELNDWLLANLNGELGLNVASVPFSCREFLEFNTVLRRVNDALLHEKATPLKDLLTSPLGWDEDRFLLRDVAFTSDENLCQACGKFPGVTQKEEEVVMCLHCAGDVKLGRQLAKARQITYHAGTGGEFSVFTDYSFSVHDKLVAVTDDVFLSLALNDWNLTGRHGPVRSRYFANAIPRFDSVLCGPCDIRECREKEQARNGQPKFFSCLAQATLRGKKALGVFKADVDNLGLVFINGFGQTTGRSIARIVTLSRMLDAFFTGRVDALLRTEFPEIYTVYAGGDDLLLLGPWDMVLRFSRRLRDEFRDYTCRNPDFTMSAGMALAKPRLPIYAVVQSAEELLDAAKKETALGEARPKDQFSTLGDRFKWTEAGRLDDEGERLADWLANSTGRLSMATVRQLLESAGQFRRFKESGDTKALSFVPMLAYTISRNIDSRKPEVVSWLHELTNLDSDNLRHLAYIANYAILSNRS